MPVSNDDLEVAGFLPSLTDRQLDLLVDEPLQESRPVLQAVAQRDKLLKGFVFHTQPLAGANEGGLDFSEIMPRNFADLVVRERCEQHDFVDAIAQLRREAALKLAH